MLPRRDPPLPGDRHLKTINPNFVDSRDQVPTERPQGGAAALPRSQEHPWLIHSHDAANTSMSIGLPTLCRGEGFPSRKRAIEQGGNQRTGCGSMLPGNITAMASGKGVIGDLSMSAAHQPHVSRRCPAMSMLCRGISANHS